MGEHNKTVMLGNIKRNDTPHAQERAAPHASEEVHAVPKGYDRLVTNILTSHSRCSNKKPAKQMAQEVLHNMQGFSRADKDSEARDKAKAHMNSMSRIWNAGKLNDEPDDDEFA